ARDPQPPHLALPAPAVAERICERVQHRLVGGPEQQLLGKPESLCAIQDRLVAAMRGDAALDSCQLLDSQRPADGLAVRLRDGLLVLVPALSLLRFVLEQMALPGRGPDELAGACDSHALGDPFLRF